MKHFFVLTVLSACAMFISCKKSSESQAMVSTTVAILVENAQGQNMLNPATSGYYKDGEIKKFDLVNGQAQLYYDSKLDWSNGYHIVTPTEMGNLNSNYYLTVEPNIKSPDNPTTTYIDWGNGDRDTLVCDMKKNNDGYYYLTQAVWFNGEKVWPEKAISGIGDRTFKVIK